MFCGLVANFQILQIKRNDLSSLQVMLLKLLLLTLARNISAPTVNGVAECFHHAHFNHIIPRSSVALWDSFQDRFYNSKYCANLGVFWSFFQARN